MCNRHASKFVIRKLKAVFASFRGPLSYELIKTYVIKKAKTLLIYLNYIITFSSAERHLQIDEAEAATANRARHRMKNLNTW